MHQISNTSLWLGHRGDLDDMRQVLGQGIEALVDVATNEPPAHLPRETFYCRFPLVDNAENPPWLVKQAIATVAGLLREKVPTLVYCVAGMSRSPCIAAAALAVVRGIEFQDALTGIADQLGMDVTPALVGQVQAIVRQPLSSANSG
jgi:hypothetical protein